MKHIKDIAFTFFIVEILCVITAAFLSWVSYFCGINSNVNLYVVLPAFGFAVTVFYAILIFIIWFKQRDPKPKPRCKLKHDIVFTCKNGSLMEISDKGDGFICVYTSNYTFELNSYQSERLINWLKK